MNTKYILDLNNTIAKIQIEEIDFVINILKQIRENNNVVWLAGNGGSAATANHMQNDLIKMCGIKAISLASNVETILAFGNDCSFRDIFKKQLDIFAQQNDVVILLSSSGTSENLEVSSDKYKTIGIFGNPENPNRIQCDIMINIDSTDIQIIEDMHSVIMHMICKVLCQVK